MTKTKVRFWRPSWASTFHGLRQRRTRKVLKSVSPFLVFPLVRYKILLRFSIILYFVSPFLLFFFFPGTFSLLTCHLQVSITARVSMTLKRHSVQSLSDHKAARTFCLSQERGIVERVVWRKIKWSFLLVWSRWGGGGGWGGRGGEWVRLGRAKRKIRLKNTPSS